KVVGDVAGAPGWGAISAGGVNEQLFVDCAMTFTVACPLLFALFESGVELDAVAVLVTLVFAGACTEYVEKMCTTKPDFTMPRLHGYAVVHAPLLETNVVPAGVGSVTVTFGAGVPPPFVTTIV